MGFYAEIKLSTNCPICGKPMGSMQTKGYEDDAEYFMEHGEPYRMELDEAMRIASELTPGGSRAVKAISSCNGCNVYADWTIYENNASHQSELPNNERKE